MAERKPRPLSEVEIQVLDVSEPPSTQSQTFGLCNQSETSISTNKKSELLPPSLQELGVLGPTTLESLHLEHAYSSLYSENEKARKERKKSFEMQQQRKTSVGTTSDSNREGHKEMITESEKSRKERKKSFDRQRSRSGTGTRAGSQQIYDIVLNECEYAFNSLYKESSIPRKERKQGIEMRRNSRDVFNVKTAENHKSRQERKKGSEKQQRRFSTGMRPISKHVYEVFPSECGHAYSSVNEEGTNDSKEQKKKILPPNGRTSNCETTKNNKQNEYNVKLDESEPNQQECKNSNDRQQRRYSTGMRCGSQKVYEIMLPENEYSYNSVYKESENQGREYKKGFGIERKNTLQEQIR